VAAALANASLDARSSQQIVGVVMRTGEARTLIDAYTRRGPSRRCALIGIPGGMGWKSRRLRAAALRSRRPGASFAGYGDVQRYPSATAAARDGCCTGEIAISASFFCADRPVMHPIGAPQMCPASRFFIMRRSARMEAKCSIKVN